MQFQLVQLGRQQIRFYLAQLQPRLRGQGDIHQDFRQHQRAIGVFLAGAQFCLECSLQHPLAGLFVCQGLKGGVDAV